MRRGIAGIEFNRLQVLPFGSWHVTVVVAQNLGECRMCRGQTRVECQGSLRSLASLPIGVSTAVKSRVVKVGYGVRLCQPCVGQREIRVMLDRTAEGREGLFQILRCALVPEIPPPHIV